MKPTVNQIKKQILTEKANQEALMGLDSTSNVGLYNLWAYSPLIPALASGAFFAFVGVIWEGIHEMDSGAKFDWTDVAANFIGAFIIVFLYHWIF